MRLRDLMYSLKSNTMLISELLNSIQERYDPSLKIINVCLVYKQDHLDSTIRFAETVKNLNHY